MAILDPRPPNSPPDGSRLYLGKHRSGPTAITNIAERFARTASAAHVPFDAYLHDLRDDIAGAFDTCEGSPTLTCTSASVLLPVGSAVVLGLVLELLVDNAVGYAFPASHRGGRIAVAFTTTPTVAVLTVEDSGTPMSLYGRRRDRGLLLARLLTLQLNGTLETMSLIGGTRSVLSVPGLQSSPSL